MELVQTYRTIQGKGGSGHRVNYVAGGRWTPIALALKTVTPLPVSAHYSFVQ